MAGRRRRNPANELGFRTAHRRRMERYEQRLEQAQGLHQELSAASELLAATVKQNPGQAAVARPLVQQMTQLADQIVDRVLREQMAGRSVGRKNQ